jgi:hypothetical protein
VTWKFNSGSVVFSSASSVTALGQPLEVTGYVSSSLGYQGLLTDADRDTYITTEETDDEDKIKFYTGGNLRMMMRNTDQSVMITDNNVGEFTPQALLHISGAGAGGDQLFIVGGGGAGNYYPNAIVVDQNGHVGIGNWQGGNANPTAPLDVSGNVNIRSDGPGTAINLEMKLSSSANDTDGSFRHRVQTHGDKQIYTLMAGATNVFRMESDAPANSIYINGSDGKVGIGTSGVDEKLHVQTSSAECRIRLETDDGYDVGILGYQASTQKLGLIYDDSDDVVTFSYGAATNNHICIDSNGKVGVNTKTPSHVLTIAGAVSGSSTLEAVGATILGSTLNVTGAATMAGKVSVDNEISGSGTLQAAGATILGSTLSVSGNVGIGVDAGSDELHVSGATGAIIIESNAASIASLQLQQGGTTYGRLQIGGGGVFNIENRVADEDMVFKVNDGGSTRTALTLDSSVSEVIVNNGADSLVDFRVEGATEDHLLFVDGSADLIGIKTDSPKVALDVHHNPTGLSDDTGGGDVAVWGAEDGTETLAAGKLMYLNTSGVWKYADADAVSTSGGVLLAIALGTSISDGLLLRGYFDAATIQGSFVKGGVCYVSETAGVIDFTRPSTSGDTVRVVGYGTNTANVIYFNPSGDWIEL